MNKGLKKRLNRGLGKAIEDWRLISDKDRILVGVSGGIDSLALLHLLYHLQKRAPVDFDILPVHIDPGFDRTYTDQLKRYVDAAYLPMEVVHTRDGIKAHSGDGGANPCFQCSWMRRKHLFQLAKTRRCKKIALGHNKDDLIETLFINIFYAGKIGTMKPRQSFFNGELDIIRPLSYVEKDDITRFAKGLDFPEFINPCPSADRTKRGEVRKMLEELYRHNKHIKGNIFRAMGNIASDYLLETPT